MRTIAASILIALLVSALALPLGARPAAACSCLAYPESEELLRPSFERGDTAYLIGAIVGSEDAGIDQRTVVQTEHVYAGKLPKRFTLDMFLCVGLGSGGPMPGERWLLEARQQDGVWRASDCTSMSMDAVGSNAYEDALNDYAGGVPLGRAYGGQHNDWLTPPVAALILVSVATVTLAAVYVAQRRAVHGSSFDD